MLETPYWLISDLIPLRKSKWKFSIHVTDWLNLKSIKNDEKWYQNELWTLEFCNRKSIFNGDKSVGGKSLEVSRHALKVCPTNMNITRVKFFFEVWNQLLMSPNSVKFTHFHLENSRKSVTKFQNSYRNSCTFISDHNLPFSSVWKPSFCNHFSIEFCVIIKFEFFVKRNQIS